MYMLNAECCVNVITVQDKRTQLAIMVFKHDTIDIPEADVVEMDPIRIKCTVPA